MKLRSLNQSKGKIIFKMMPTKSNLDPPKKQAPITRARLKNLSPRNAKLFLERSETNQNSSKKNPTQKTSRIRTTNPKIKTMAAKTRMNQKKPTEISEKELFTDLTFPTGFFAKLFKQIKFHKLTHEMCRIFYSNTKPHHFTKRFKETLTVGNGLSLQYLIQYLPIS